MRLGTHSFLRCFRMPIRCIRFPSSVVVAAGYTLKLPFEDKKMQSRKQFLDDIAATLGGYVAEEMLFDDVTTGPSNDLMVITALARDMVVRYGMSEKLGPIAFGERQLGNEPYSEHVAMQIDAEVARIIDEAKARAKQVISEHRDALDAIAKELIEKETIERDEFEKILIANGITPKREKRRVCHRAVAGASPKCVHKSVLDL